jgi:starvation-inducible DNA-binding protein
MANHKKQDTEEIIQALTIFLADTTILYYKTHAFHWNVQGDNFYGLHLMFEKFYTKLWKSMDEIAERIRALGEKAPSSFAELLRQGSIAESEASPQPQGMIQILRNDYFALAKEAYAVCEIAAEHGDLVTVDILTKKATFLEKAAWMCHSTLSGE